MLIEYLLAKFAVMTNEIMPELGTLLLWISRSTHNLNQGGRVTKKKIFKSK